ncbi:MAG: DUF4421 domain-containing protein [Treponema sp.]|nr:DUF4421 domain-containing protein [Treponema sp.]
MSFFILPPLFTSAEAAITVFDESWAIKALGKYTITSFSQEQPAQYTTAKPWSFGLGLRYKDVSASVSLPSFYASGGHPFESFDIQLSSYYDSVYYEVFCRRYQDFTDKKTGNNGVDLRVFSSGISAGWLQNGKRHSLSAAYDLDCRQLSSSGSIILGIGIFYTSIFGGDERIKHYNETQRFVYSGPNLGYSYTIIFPNDIFLNVNFVIGLNAGLNITANTWHFIPDIIPKLSFGHHNKSWSINFTAGGNYTAIPREVNTADHLLSGAMKVTFSNRF